MQAFEYASPRTLPEALGLLASKWGETDVLAGGTDLLGLLKDYIHTPRLIVSLSGIKELRGIRFATDGLHIGAMVTLEELLEHARVRREYPALMAAARGVASPQIRAMGTVGGDLCQRPRCWYFRRGFGLLARDATGRELAPGGENRYHAILGNQGPAKFVSASSLGPPFVAFGAKAVIASMRGRRTTEVQQFFRAPTGPAMREVDLEPAEILTEVIVPLAGAVRNATYEVRQRQALDWPLATASVALSMEGPRVDTARIVLGHVAPTPWYSPEAAAVLAGRRVDESIAREAADSALAKATPLSKNAYKVQLAKVAIRRALLAAVGAA
jgi:xanthine dehydrogenase YagS FAD-binding subunit